MAAVPSTNTKTVTGSKIKAMPKQIKYKRKNRGDKNSPVEKIRRKIIVFNTKILKEALLLKESIALVLLFRAEEIRNKKIKNPNIWIVYWERMVFCQAKINANDKRSKSDCLMTFMQNNSKEFSLKRQV